MGYVARGGKFIGNQSFDQRNIENVRRAFRWDGFEIEIYWPKFDGQVISFNPEHGYPAAEGLFYECMTCGTMIPSLPPDSTSCRCHNISIDVDYGRLSIKNHDEARLFAVD